uniref:Uncharacterized protein n=1 Tax=viral metagenome TaxID=1070528 RepID=A0A6M3LU49_9ZZZZ
MAVEEQTTQTGTAFTYGGGRDGQRLIINFRTVSKLAFLVRKDGSPSGDLVFRIRKVSDDSIIVSKVWGDVSDLPGTLTWEEVTFDSPVTIEDEVRIALEFGGGDADNGVSSGMAGNVKGSEIYTGWPPGGSEWVDFVEYDFCYKYTYTLPPDDYTIDTGFDALATAYEWQRKTFKNPRGLGYYYALIKTSADRWRFHKSPAGPSWSIATNTQELLEAIPPALCIYEDSANTRLIVYLVYKTGTRIRTFAKTIEDDSSDFTVAGVLWEADVAIKTDDGVYFPNICIDDGGYLWVSLTDVYDKADHAQIRVARSTVPHPTSAPSWDIATIYGEPGGEFGRKGLDFGSGPKPRSELVPLTATADVAIIVGYYNDAIPASSMDGLTLTYSAGIQKGPVVAHDATVHTDLMHSSVAESGVNSDVFIGYKDADGSLKCIKWDVSAASSTAFGNVFDSTVDSLALSIDKNADPDKIYAFYVKNGVAGDLFYKTSSVDSASWPLEETIDDDSEALDYLSASYQDWTLDGDVQIIYTRQTWLKVRFWAVGGAPPIFEETIVAQHFPMHYLSKPVKAQELISKVEGATITHTTQDFPETLLKKGKAQELRSKWFP